MSPTFRAACVQTNSGREIGPNVVTVCERIRRARDLGADLVLLPENVSMMEPDNRLLREKAVPEADHPALAAFADAARATGAWVLIGSLAIRADDGMVANRSFLLDDTGTIAARYDKIHLFDVDLGGGERYRESATFVAGGRSVVAATPWGELGLTICYDVRFPGLYRRLAQAGAAFICIPAAFTKVTGEAHWHILVRARAIENGCYVFAPAQCGTHAEGRQTFGHSLIVDPWGAVLADGGESEGIVMAEIDAAKVADARRRVPALHHERPFD
jgi:predicted amidohydrolase